MLNFVTKFKRWTRGKFNARRDRKRQEAKLYFEVKVIRYVRFIAIATGITAVIPAMRLYYTFGEFVKFQLIMLYIYLVGLYEQIANAIQQLFI